MYIISVSKVAIITFSSLCLLACGGGSGSPSSLDNKATSSISSFPPDSEKLMTNAGESNDLYIEEDFNFTHLKQTQLTVQISNEMGEAVPFARTNVYLLDQDTINASQSIWKDEMSDKAQLIAQGQTNAQGEFIRNIEFPAVTNTAPHLLIEVNILGIENKSMISIEREQTYVSLGL